MTVTCARRKVRGGEERCTERHACIVVLWLLIAHSPYLPRVAAQYITQTAPPASSQHIRTLLLSKRCRNSSKLEWHRCGCAYGLGASIAVILCHYTCGWLFHWQCQNYSEELREICHPSTWMMEIGTPNSRIFTGKGISLAYIIKINGCKSLALEQHAPAVSALTGVTRGFAKKASHLTIRLMTLKHSMFS